ncbi:MAG: YihY/virulence factor BrkB family protein [Saprospiraceae bacterium]|nr:YihY/virulence factor BrkB family protein [Saprospiraceae bacterium]
MKPPDGKKRTRIGKVVQWIKAWSQHNSLPGFGGIPIYDVLAFIRNELRQENIIIRANAMAFSFLLAIFPAIIFLFTLLPYLPIEGFTQAMTQSIREVLPEQAAQYIIDIIEQLTSISQGGLLSIGLVLALWFSSNGMISMLRGFEKSYDISYKQRSWWRHRLVALELTLILGTLFILSMAMIVFGRQLTEAIMEWGVIELKNLDELRLIRWFAIIALFYAGISTLYRYGPALKRRIRFFSPGATLATILSLLSSLAFAYYVNRFDTYNQIYGSLGALIVLMLWLQINSLIVLIGYELNASIKVNKALVYRKRRKDS